MITKALFPILLAIILSDLYLELRFLRRSRWYWHLLWWIPGIGMMVYAAILAREKHFLPDNPDVAYVFLFLFGLLVVPKLLFSLCSVLGALFNRLCQFLGRSRPQTQPKKRRNYGEPIGLAVALFGLYILFYGSFIGFGKLEVRHVDITFDDLPAAFDGYRIVQFSDVHLGTYTGSRQNILKQAVDSINAQQADLITFTGDLQNMHPSEIPPHMPLLKTLKAKDGVFSVMGNHDYPFYYKAEDMEEMFNFEKTVGYQEEMGWKVLLNSRCYLHRGNDSIVIAGMENDGEGRFPQYGNIGQALYRVNRRKILRKSHTQLTLSGHTHAGQFSLFGLSPARFRYRECDGLYHFGQRYLYVSKGVGALIPFRFGATGEIVVITLRKGQAKQKQA